MRKKKKKNPVFQIKQRYIQINNFPMDLSNTFNNISFLMSVTASFCVNFDLKVCVWFNSLQSESYYYLKKTYQIKTFSFQLWREVFGAFFPPLTVFTTLEMMENIVWTYYFEYHFFPTFGGILSNKTVISKSFLPTYSLYLFEAES